MYTFPPRPPRALAPNPAAPGKAGSGIWADVKAECAAAITMPPMIAASAKRLRRFVGMENLMNGVLPFQALPQRHRATEGQRGSGGALTSPPFLSVPLWLCVSVAISVQ